jgi:uncharacterized membrane protein YfcA
MIISTLLLVPISFAAGVISSIAGGGAFLVFPALLLAGLDPRAANITSTLAMYPMQVSSGFTGRSNIAGTRHLSFKALFIISLVGGAIGAVLLLCTSPNYFAKLVPWLILFATMIFAWGSFRKTAPNTAEVYKSHSDRLGKVGAALSQLAISIYGGYFGGGIGLMMLATLTYAGMNIRQAITTKNILAAVMNTAAVGIFFILTKFHWLLVGIIAIASSAGGLVGVRLLNRVNERHLRLSVVAYGVILALVMFLRAH